MKNLFSDTLKLLIVLFFVAQSSTTFAQKKGDSFWKEEEKKAKQGDLRAMVALGDAYRGNIFSQDDDRNFEKALKWYKKAQLSTLGTKGQKGELGLFLIHWLGGYDLERNEAEGLRWLNEIKQQSWATRTYDDKANISLLDLAKVQTEAEKGVEEAQILLARIYLEFNLDYPRAIAWLDRADMNGSLDAPYLKAKWALIRQNPHFLDPNNWTEYHKAMASIWQRAIAEGSTMAQIEYTAAQIQSNRVDAKNVEKMIEIASKKRTSPEMAAKSLLMVYAVKAGKEKFVYLRKFAEVAKNIDFTYSTQAQEALKEWAHFNKKMSTLSGYVEYAADRKDLRNDIINTADYRADFQGKIKPLSDFYHALHKPDNVAFIGSDNIKNYDNEFYSKVFRVFQRINHLDDLMEFRRVMNDESWLSPLRSEYEARYPNKFAELGVAADRIAYYQEKDKLHRKKFTNFAEGRLFLSELILRNDLTASLKNELTSDTKKQIIYDIYGRSPSKKQLSQLQDVIYREKWILPEGEQIYFEMQHDSDNSFAGDVTLNKVLYHYQCTRKGEGSRFELTIHAVKNNQSNLVYKGNIDAQNKDANTVAVKIFKAKFNVYRWVDSAQDYLLTTVSAQSSQIETAEMGDISIYKSSAHGMSPTQLTQKDQAREFSQKVAVKSAVKYFILAYTNLLTTI
ncbi:MAG: sel1 repeat family protein [Cytophagales bacterium]|nr:MAG: sel1 repeat family protein [Cytophagales bacterium]TAF62337.1 MAG: sel1 repeat family protein [Cytophagales bacterium]